MSLYDVDEPTFTPEELESEVKKIPTEEEIRIMIDGDGIAEDFNVFQDFDRRGRHWGWDESYD